MPTPSLGDFGIDIRKLHTDSGKVLGHVHVESRQGEPTFGHKTAKRGRETGYSTEEEGDDCMQFVAFSAPVNRLTLVLLIRTCR